MKEIIIIFAATHMTLAINLFTTGSWSTAHAIFLTLQHGGKLNRTDWGNDTDCRNSRIYVPEWQTKPLRRDLAKFAKKGKIAVNGRGFRGSAVSLRPSKGKFLDDFFGQLEQKTLYEYYRWFKNRHPDR